MVSKVIKALKVRLFLISFLSVSLLSSSVFASAMVKIVDDIGRNIEVKLPVERVISIQPSTTEIIFALGAQKKLIGRTDFCDYPEEVKSIPSIGGVSNPSPDRMISLRPNVIFTSTMFPKAMAEPLMKAYPLIVLEPKNIMGVYDNISTVGKILQKQKEADDLAASLDALRRPIEAYFQNLSNKPTVLVLVWHDPLITVGPTSFIATVIEKGGGKNYIQKDIGAYPMISPESLILNEPDIILYPTKSMGLDPAFLQQNPFKNLKAVKNGNALPFDDDLLFRPGPRVMRGMLEVSKAIDPTLKTSSIFALSTTKQVVFKDGSKLSNIMQLKNIKGRIYVDQLTLETITVSLVKQVKIINQSTANILLNDGKLLTVSIKEGLFPLRLVVESLKGKIFWNGQHQEVYIFIK